MCDDERGSSPEGADDLSCFSKCVIWTYGLGYGFQGLILVSRPWRIRWPMLSTGIWILGPGFEPQGWGLGHCPKKALLFSLNCSIWDKSIRLTMAWVNWVIHNSYLKFRPRFTFKKKQLSKAWTPNLDTRKAHLSMTPLSLLKENGMTALNLKISMFHFFFEKEHLGY